MKLSLPLILIFALCGCQANNFDGYTFYDPLEPVAYAGPTPVYLRGTFDDVNLSALTDAEKAWNDMLPAPMFGDPHPLGDHKAICGEIIVEMKTVPRIGDVGLWEYKKCVQYITVDPDSGEWREGVYMHELGHAARLDHDVPDGPHPDWDTSIMREESTFDAGSLVIKPWHIQSILAHYYVGWSQNL